MTDHPVIQSSPLLFLCASFDSLSCLKAADVTVELPFLLGNTHEETNPKDSCPNNINPVLVVGVLAWHQTFARGAHMNERMGKGGYTLSGSVPPDEKGPILFSLG
ncbi:hypothetical protein B0F90DRAFT_1737653 [Multifurca ochricompacta]|uniref:Uncharacterized protein n=1 Tax=Multifurca ochricompacta TaxID=376703 RepID=A0AAD4M0I7_9AGAM|nr:hypothetical protein B0F90DRAFT_1737653 [Multifurca ochricompacta]